MGTIADDAGNGVAGASVFVPFAKDRYWGGSTDTQGRYSFVARVSDYTQIRPVAMIVFKDGYLPRTFYYKAMRDGEDLILPVDAAYATRRAGPPASCPGVVVGL